MVYGYSIIIYKSDSAQEQKFKRSLCRQETMRAIAVDMPEQDGQTYQMVCGSRQTGVAGYPVEQCTTYTFEVRIDI